MLAVETEHFLSYPTFSPNQLKKMTVMQSNTNSQMKKFKCAKKASAFLRGHLYEGMQATAPIEDEEDEALLTYYC